MKLKRKLAAALSLALATAVCLWAQAETQNETPQSKPTPNQLEEHNSVVDDIREAVFRGLFEDNAPEEGAKPRRFFLALVDNDKPGDPRWPEGYVIAEGSESPDGRYGVLIPTREEQELLADEKIVNTLVNLKTHGRLCVIRGAQYWESQNHYGLTVDWAEDSSWCAVTYDGRYGFENITLVELHGAICKQTDIGKHILKSLSDCPGIAYFRSGPGRTILVRAIAYSDPKGMNPNHTDDPFFQGTFDLATKKWTRSESRRLPNIDAMRHACADTLDEHITFSSDEERLRSYDELLNDVYSAVRMVLPSERFASVKKEQIAWLKKLESSDSAAKKCEFMAARIQELRRLLW